MKRFADRQRGLVLASSLLLLVVVTIMAVSMFRSFGMQERIASNVREKHRALQSAQAAQQYAEDWLSKNAIGTNAVTCTTGMLNGNNGAAQICTTATSLANISGKTATTVPWLGTDGVDVGTWVTPKGTTYGQTAADMQTSTAGGAYTYYSLPRSYITDLGPSSTTGTGEAYLIDAVGFGGTADAVAVIESTFAVYTSSWDPSK